MKKLFSIVKMLSEKRFAELHSDCCLNIGIFQKTLFCLKLKTQKIVNKLCIR